MATTPKAPKDDNKMVIAIQLSGDAYKPFREAFKHYANLPENQSFSAAALALSALARDMKFDLSTLTERRTRAKSSEDKKLAKQLMEKVVKAKDINGMAKYLIRQGVDVSDMFTPQQIAQFTKEIAEEDKN